MLSDEKISRIQMLARNGVDVPGISQEIGCDFKTVKKYLGAPDEEYYHHPQPRETYPNYSRFKTERERRIENEVNSIISERDAKDLAYGVAPQTSIQQYEERQILKLEITRKHEQEDNRRKQEEEHKERMRALELLEMETRLKQQNQATPAVTNPAIIQLQQQLESQSAETARLKEELSIKKESSMVDTIKRLENQITEASKKNNREWWEK